MHFLAQPQLCRPRQPLARFASAVARHSRSQRVRIGAVIMLAVCLAIAPSLPAFAQNFMSSAMLNSNAGLDSGEDTRPVVATDGNGTWITVWVSTEDLGGGIGTDSDLLFARSTDDGTTWSVPAVLNSNASDIPGGEDLRPQIAVYGGKWVVVWSSTDSLGGAIGSDADILYATSSNGGIGWSGAQTLNSNATTDSGDDLQPALAVDGTGVWLAAWESNDSLSGTIGTDLDPLFVRSTNGAVSWSAPAPLASYAGSDGVFDSDQQVDVSCNDSGVCVAVWSSVYNLGSSLGNDFDILTSYSLDHGASWSAAASLKSNAASDSTYLDVNPRIENNGPGIWVTAWDSGDPTIANGLDYDVVWSRSTNAINWAAPSSLGGTAFSSDTINDRIDGIVNDRNGGNWIAFWNTDHRWGTDQDIAIVRSNDVALSWSSMTFINTDPLFDSGADRNAAMATDQLGHWVAVWQATDAPSSPTGLDYDILVATGWGPDSDGDGLADGAENNLYGTNPFNPDSDGDGLSDGDEINTYGTNPLLADSDGDGLSDGAEVNTYGTDPLLPDTDGDGFSDGDEIAAGSDPLSAASKPLGFLPTALALNTNAASDTGTDGGQRVASDGGSGRMAVWLSDDPLGMGLGTDFDIFFAYSSDGGQSWGAPAPVNGNAATDSGNDLIAAVATDGTGTWLVVWMTDDTLGGTIGTDTDLLFALSSDNGQHWSAPQPLNTDATTDTADERELRVESDGAGGWLVVWQSSGRFGSDFDILYTRSTDAGASWSAPALVDPGEASDTASDSMPDLAGDGAGTWLVTWASNNTLGGTIGSDSDLLYSYSTDNGVSWSAVAALNANAATDTGADYAPSVVTDGLGVWMAAWHSLDSLGGTIGNDADILVARSAGLSGGWHSPAALNTNAASDSGSDRDPTLTSDAAGSWLAAWSSTDSLGATTGTDEDILFSQSADGLAWTSVAPLSGNATSDSGNDFTPSATSNRNGSWLVVWQSNDTLGGVISSDWDGLYSTGTGPDRDGDGLYDAAEVNTYGTDPALADSDGDGLGDGAEVNVYGTDPLLTDTDGDGLTDGDEVNLYGTDPLLADTDGDGFSDGVEIAAGTDPLNAASHPASVPALSWSLRLLCALLLAVAGAAATRRLQSCQPDSE